MAVALFARWQARANPSEVGGVLPFLMPVMVERLGTDSRQEPSEEERDADLAAFLQEVNKLIEMEPEKMTGAQHIDRLFRPGSKYFNMNPFEVLGLDWDADPDAVKKAYRRMSVQVHPDKNPDDPEARSE